MGDDESKKVAALYRRIHGEIADDLDEELELELDDDRGGQSLDDVIEHPAAATEARKFYFKELLRL